jgi:hypothetical protein
MKIDEKPSRYGGRFFYVFFKGEDGKQYYTCLYPKCRNFPRWKKVMKEGIILENLNIKDAKTRLIDADSFPRKA